MKHLCEYCKTQDARRMADRSVCSRSCLFASMRTVPETACAECGVTVRKKRFCSQSCYWKSLTGKSRPTNTQVSLTCLHCGSSFKVRRYRVAAGARFCSRSCSSSSRLKGNTTALERLRRSATYKRWRKSVFERDRYTCQECGNRGGYLNADHIKPFALFPALRFDVTNGRTLCVPCHRKTETYGMRLVWAQRKATGY